MRAMVLAKSGQVEDSPLKLEERPIPTPGPGEVRLKVRVCAVCRTDLHIVEGEVVPPRLPIIPGHQVVGIVDAVGLGCTRLRAGMRVGVAWLRHTCGQCRFCRAGRENLCPQSRFTGFDADGGYAEYAVVPEDYAYVIPQAFSDLDAAPLLCAGIIGYRSLKRCAPQRGEVLALYGFGSSAHIVLQLALRRGYTVYVVSRAPRHQKLALDLGAHWAGVDAAQMPAPAQGAIMFAPAGGLVLPALAGLDHGGVLALAGIHMSAIPEMDYQKYLYYERDIHPVTANTRQDGMELLAEAAAVPVRPHTRAYRLEDANEALQDMKADRLDGTGVLVISQ
jgi:alcohol dehydrogenase, propanol-preferring